MWIDLPSLRRNAFLLFNAITIAFIAGLFFPDKTKNSEPNFKYLSVASVPATASFSNVTKPYESESAKDSFLNFVFSLWNVLLTQEFSYRPSTYFISFIQRNVYYVFISINAP